MTQLLLFDGPISNSTATAVAPATPNQPASPVEAASPSEIAATDTALPGRPTHGKRPSGSRIDDHQPGVHRMGDLARLVLMRYDMVAQRRAELAKKRQAESAERRQLAR